MERSRGVVAGGPPAAVAGAAAPTRSRTPSPGCGAAAALAVATETGRRRAHREQTREVPLPGVTPREREPRRGADAAPGAEEGVAGGGVAAERGAPPRGPEADPARAPASPPGAAAARRGADPGGGGAGDAAVAAEASPGAAPRRAAPDPRPIAGSVDSDRGPSPPHAVRSSFPPTRDETSRLPPRGSRLARVVFPVRPPSPKGAPVDDLLRPQDAGAAFGYFTRQPYGFVFGVETALPSISSSSALRM